jgi:hypothetical protein
MRLFSAFHQEMDRKFADIAEFAEITLRTSRSKLIPAAW